MESMRKGQAARKPLIGYMKDSSSHLNRKKNLTIRRSRIVARFKSMLIEAESTNIPRLRTLIPDYPTILSIYFVRLIYYY